MRRHNRLGVAGLLLPTRQLNFDLGCSAMEESSSSAISGPKEGHSVDAHAAKIVFCCSMNHACIIWQSLLNHQLEALPDVIKKLDSLMEGALSLIAGSSELKAESLRILCARSPGFLRLVTCIAVAVTMGEYVRVHDNKLQATPFSL